MPATVDVPAGVKLELRTAQLAGKISRLLKQLDGPTAAAARVSQALEAALASEGLHAEPLIPGKHPAASNQRERMRQAAAPRR